VDGWIDEEGLDSQNHGMRRGYEVVSRPIGKILVHRFSQLEFNV
jgi:hypothetical protein